MLVWRSGKRVKRSEDVEGEENPEGKENLEENPQGTQKARTMPNTREYAAKHPSGAKVVD